MPTFHLHSVSKHFIGQDGRRVGAVQKVSLSVAEGELQVVVGPSACGKTTLLRLIAGLEFADEGQVWIADVDVTRRLPGDRDVAMVFQTLALYPHMNVAQNIGFGLRLRSVADAEIRRRTLDIAERMNVRECLDRHPFELSAGQGQRVALARALIRQPGILLLDEPLSHLDGPLRRRLCQELRTLHTEFNLTTLLVTHDLAEAEALGHRLAVMNQGRIEQVGTAHAIRSHPANPFVAEFLKPGLD